MGINELPKIETKSSNNQKESKEQEITKIPNLLKNIPMSTDTKPNLLKNIPIANNIPKADPLDSLKGRTGNMEDLLKVASSMGDILPKNVDLRSIAHNKNDL